jgi:hypothetical protein
MSRTSFTVILILAIILAVIVNMTYLYKHTDLAEKTSNLSSSILDIIKKESFNSSALSKTISGREDSGDSGSSGIKTTNPTSSNSTNSTQNQCITKYNFTSNTIIFYNVNELHSNNMKPIVQSLMQYKFYWKNTTYDSEFNTCFEYSQIVTPEFICIGTNQRLIGEVSKSALEGFASSCH